MNNLTYQIVENDQKCKLLHSNEFEIELSTIWTIKDYVNGDIKLIHGKNGRGSVNNRMQSI